MDQGCAYRLRERLNLISSTWKDFMCIIVRVLQYG